MYTHLELRDSARVPVSLSTLDKMKREREKIACLTCYDASFAVLLDIADVDVILVGDSLGMVIQGHDTTVPVTMDDIVYHCRAVSRGVHRPFLMADLPFMSYPSKERARNSVRLMQEGGAEMVKLESGAARSRSSSSSPSTTSRCRAPRSEAPVRAQRRRLRRAGRRPRAACSRREGARGGRRRHHPAQAFERLGAEITAALEVPVIGIGAGPATDGQILVLYDILDITSGRKPRFVRNFMEGAGNNLEAARAYVRAVRDGSYPGREHGFT